MKLYIFSISKYSKTPKFTMEKIEVEEKSKTYVCNGRRFLKADIGRASGNNNDECLLLENNPSKAATIIKASCQDKLAKMLTQVERQKEEIANLERYIR